MYIYFKRLYVYIVDFTSQPYFNYQSGTNNYIYLSYRTDWMENFVAILQKPYFKLLNILCLINYFILPYFSILTRIPYFNFNTPKITY